MREKPYVRLYRSIYIPCTRKKKKEKKKIDPYIDIFMYIHDVDTYFGSG